ncbi:defensin-2-like precursor [Nasonia vitripennis]|uniref:Defensin 2-1 n=1 Tax=Nasonia vitripennis TaxID=7425 RepID=I1ZEK9_NASVI|nr:defensin-2-like precursor [Nasonia vitripennis]AFJ22690.1 defensin 2-1 precursor [Nasonia vitripennis]
MKVLVALAVCALVASAYGASLGVFDGPVYFDDETLTSVEAQFQLDHRDLSDLTLVEQPSFRARRFTCDVLSFKSMWVSPNHSACAVRCLAQRRKGGKCKNGDCVCR